MKRIIILFLVLFLTFQNSTFVIATPSVSAKSAIIIDTITGKVLYEKNAYQKLPMASTTKIMTAIIAIEHGNISDVITTSKNAAYVEGSSIWLSENEKITMENALYGLLLNSGNDVAIAIAEHISGNVEKFVQLMNLKAKEIGANNTNFVNPNGLHNDEHYTTAFDLAIIMKYGLQNPIFREIIKTKNKVIPWEGHQWNRSLKNHNKLLWNYEYCDGGKTGFTKKAGRCLVTSSTKDNWQVVAVTLNAGDDWNDHINMYNYAFQTYKLKEVVELNEYMKTIKVLNGKNNNKVKLITNESLKIPVAEDKEDNIEIKYNGPDFVYAPVIQNQKVGKMDVYYGNNLISSIELISANYITEINLKVNLLKIMKNWMYLFDLGNIN